MVLLDITVSLISMLLVANLANTKWCKKSQLMTDTLANCYSIWELSRAFQWIPIWQGLDDFQKSLRRCALDNVASALKGLKAYKLGRSWLNRNMTDKVTNEIEQTKVAILLTLRYLLLTFDQKCFFCGKKW